jgi:hypothetical protein
LQAPDQPQVVQDLRAVAATKWPLATPDQKRLLNFKVCISSCDMPQA